MAFVDSRVSSDSIRRRLRRVSLGERIEEATSFLQQFHAEARLPDAALRARTSDVVRSLRRRRTYEHTPEELAFGARVAWRNHGRCIGRMNWKALEVRDCRAITSPGEIVQELSEHLRQAYNGGRIRSIISVFAPFLEGSPTTFIENNQLTQYAGYRLDGGGILGDPQNAEFTRSAMALGWRPPPTRSPFDLLPLILEAGGARAVYSLDPDCLAEIPISHPTCAAVANLGLRWHAVPVVSDMIMTIGGIDYPCAPFNGHYMCTEIASRNLADEFRYALAPEFARALGADVDDPLWRDSVLTEMNRAVLHSFTRADVRIVDHHEASAQFLTFRERELASGRFPSADWAWIVPPQASAGCPVFNLEMKDAQDVPNFYRSRVVDGSRLRLSRITLERSFWQRKLETARERWRTYRRRHG